MKSRRGMFLAGSFLSYFGDAIVLFALPTGLGVSTGNIQATVLMFLIPAIAIFLSSFLGQRVRNRVNMRAVNFAHGRVGRTVFPLAIEEADLVFCRHKEIDLLLGLGGVPVIDSIKIAVAEYAIVRLKKRPKDLRIRTPLLNSRPDVD